MNVIAISNIQQTKIARTPKIRSIVGVRGIDRGAVVSGLSGKDLFSNDNTAKQDQGRSVGVQKITGDGLPPKDNSPTQVVPHCSGNTTIYYNDQDTNIPKKSGRGRKPKNTVENTKQKITETRAQQNPETTPENPETEITLQLQTFHHNFSNQIAERFTYFATLHRYDDRKTFKDAWKKWIVEEDVAADIQTEIQSLEANHYAGDILDKMFKSVRYYYRKKPITSKAPTTRKSYVALPVSILESMDEHIIETMIQHTNHVTARTPEIRSIVGVRGITGEDLSSKVIAECSISPAKAFELYMQRHKQTNQPAQEHPNQFTQIQEQTQEQIKIDIPKYKKTYKNRFFIASKNIRQMGGTNGSPSPRETKVSL